MPHPSNNRRLVHEKAANCKRCFGYKANQLPYKDHPRLLHSSSHPELSFKVQHASPFPLFCRSTK